MPRELKLLKTYFGLFILGLSILVLSSVVWNVKKEKDLAIEYATIEANASYNKDLLYRRWASQHSGVFVPISETTPPNPHLTFVEEREITAANGKEYTLVNPAYMTRQVHELGDEQYGVKGHITSLDPIREKNKPDEWETKALELFEKGERTFVEVENIGGEPHLRYMHAMITEKSCLKCHSHQGYKEGDVRGGISVSVPLDKYYAVAASKIKLLSFTYISIYLLILLMSSLAFRQYSRELLERIKIGHKVEETKTLLQRQNDEYSTLNEEYKSQNEELKIARDKAEESNQLKTAFLHNLSHEIRTPLNAICGFSNMLNNNQLNQQKKAEFAQIIQNSSNQLLTIVNDVLTVSSIETGQEAIEVENLLPDEFFREIYQQYKDRCKNKGIILEISGLGQTNGTMVLTDKAKLTQMLVHLLNNAVKFTHEGKISLQYELLKPLKTQNTSILKVSVTDTGIGIAPEHLDIIFERFRQADQSISQQYGGTGLGLSIVKGYAELLGGSVEVESQVNKGTKFLLDIPVEINQQVLKKMHQGQSPADQVSIKTVLVAEDEPYNYQLIAEILSEYPLEIYHAKNGKEAVNHCLNNNCFDVVLMDIKMPGWMG